MIKLKDLLIEDQKIYVKSGQSAPKGKKLQIGPRGGKYFMGTPEEKKAQENPAKKTNNKQEYNDLVNLAKKMGAPPPRPDTDLISYKSSLNIPLSSEEKNELELRKKTAEKTGYFLDVFGNLIPPPEPGSDIESYKIMNNIPLSSEEEEKLKGGQKRKLEWEDWDKKKRHNLIDVKTLLDKKSKYLVDKKINPDEKTHITHLREDQILITRREKISKRDIKNMQKNARSISKQVNEQFYDKIDNESDRKKLKNAFKIWKSGGMSAESKKVKNMVYSTIDELSKKNPPVFNTNYPIFRGMHIPVKDLKLFLSNFKVGKNVKLSTGGYSADPILSAQFGGEYYSDEQIDKVGNTDGNIDEVGIMFIVKPNKNNKMTGMPVYDNKYTFSNELDDEYEIIRPENAPNKVLNITKNFVTDDNDEISLHYIIELEDVGTNIKENISLKDILNSNIKKMLKKYTSGPIDKFSKNSSVKIPNNISKSMNNDWNNHMDDIVNNYEGVQDSEKIVKANKTIKSVINKKFGKNAKYVDSEDNHDVTNYVEKLNKQKPDFEKTWKDADVIQSLKIYGNTAVSSYKDYGGHIYTLIMKNK